MSAPIRILYDIHPHIVGGTERFLMRLFAQLDRTRFEPVVISSMRGRAVRLVESMRVKTVIAKGLSSQWALPGIAEFIRRQEIRLVQSNYYAPGLAMAAGLANVPHIWRPGGHIDVVSADRERMTGRVVSAVEARVILESLTMLSSAIVCNSRYVRRQFRSRASDRIAVIPNGIAIPRQPRRRRRTGPIRIGMIAHFTPQKRHEDFLRAARLLVQTRDDVMFAILGGPYAHEASRRYADCIRREAQRLLGAGRIEIKECDGSAADAVPSCDVLVLPSVGESCSNAILEAMAAGVPVVASRSGGNPELMTHRKTGLLVKPERPDLLAKAMHWLVSHQERMYRIGRAGQRDVRARFSIATCAKKYEAVYADLL